MPCLFCFLSGTDFKRRESVRGEIEWLHLHKLKVAEEVLTPQHQSRQLVRVLYTVPKIKNFQKNLSNQKTIPVIIK